MASQTRSPPAPGLAELAEARALLAANRPAEALMQAETAVALRPRDAEAAHLRDAVIAAIGAMDPALAKLELSAALHAGRADLQYELGQAYVTLDRPADAERCFKRVLGLAPNSAEAHAALGALYLSVSIVDGAEHHSRRALEIEPTHAVASQTLASMLEARGESAEAQAQLARAYSRQALFVQPAPAPRLRVLVLATTSAGNIPYRFIMPSRFYTRLVWYMEHARPDEQPAPDQYDIVFNAIGDADLAQPSQAAVDAFLAACPKPSLNSPAAVARTRRDRLPGLLDGLSDVVVPRTLRLAAGVAQGAELSDMARAHGFEGPLLVRPIGSHGGRDLERAADPAALAQLSLDPGLDHYLTAFVDFSSPDGLFRKYRMFFVGGEVFPYHLAIAQGWLVHHDTSGMREHAERRAEEARFLADTAQVIGGRALSAVTQIGARLGLDYCGVDFSVLPDGRVLVFEANATMLAHPEDADGPYAHKNIYVDRICEAFQQMLATRAG